MLLVKGDGSNTSPEQMQKKLQSYMVWMEKWKSTGNYVDGSPFRTEGAFIPDLKNTVVEDDYLNPRETIGGFIWIKASDMDQASEIAKECPLLDGCGIYVRPFMKM
ncbi:MAG: YciI family protein [Cyclobacteriaceae bacterium]